MKLPSILVLNFDSVQEFVSYKRHVLISIRSRYDSEQPKLPDCIQRVAILYRWFSDVDDKGYKILSEQYKSETLDRHVKVIDEDDAERIASFVVQWAPSVELIVVHCDAGISRSPGIAAAVTKAFGESDDWYFKHFIPNRRVYRLVLEATSKALQQ